MLWWDELDDVVAVCRHVARAMLEEIAAVKPLRTWGSAIGEWLRLPA